MSANMQFSGNTDCHTSDVGHWFAMTKTDFVDSLKRLSLSAEPFCFVFVQGTGMRRSLNHSLVATSPCGS